MSRCMLDFVTQMNVIFLDWKDLRSDVLEVKY